MGLGVPRRDSMTPAGRLVGAKDGEQLQWQQGHEMQSLSDAAIKWNKEGITSLCSGMEQNPSKKRPETEAG